MSNILKVTICKDQILAQKQRTLLLKNLMILKHSYDTESYNARYEYRICRQSSTVGLLFTFLFLAYNCLHKRLEKMEVIESN